MAKQSPNKLSFCPPGCDCPVCSRKPITVGDIMTTDYVQKEKARRDRKQRRNERPQMSEACQMDDHEYCEEHGCPCDHHLSESEEREYSDQPRSRMRY